jgi:peptide-methionine (R)-S-oxide reductase
MFYRRAIVLAIGCGSVLTLWDRGLGISSYAEEPATTARQSASKKIVPIHKSLSEWKQQLTRKQYNVTRRGETEPPFSGKLWNNKRHGSYHCLCCQLELFSWQTKFESNTGWPSFWQSVDKDCIHLAEDRSDPNEVRTEVLCARCDAHLGHVFDDGPPPTGLRFCMNSTALAFVEVVGEPAPPAQAAAIRARGK